MEEQIIRVTIRFREGTTQIEKEIMIINDEALKFQMVKQKFEVVKGRIKVEYIKGGVKLVNRKELDRIVKDYNATEYAGWKYIH
jgi:hypothetical protein